MAKTGLPLGKVVRILEAICRADPQQNMHTRTAMVFLYVYMSPGISVGQVQRLTNFNKAAASRHVRVLTHAGDPVRDRIGIGLLEFYSDEADLRMKRIKLTPKGERLRDEIRKLLGI